MPYLDDGGIEDQRDCAELRSELTGWFIRI